MSAGFGRHATGPTWWVDCDECMTFVSNLPDEGTAQLRAQAHDAEHHDEAA